MGKTWLTLVIAAGMAGSAAGQDLLLVPDSGGNRVWAFDASDGSVVTDEYIANPGTVNGVALFNRPIEVLVSSTGTLLVTDQFSHLVSEFALDGSFIRAFSLGGVRDTAIISNMRGGHIMSDGPFAGEVLVCNSGGNNALLVSARNIKRLDPDDGTELADFAFNRYGGIRGPFDAIEYNGSLLVTDERQRAIVRYTLEGKFDDRFASAFDYPQIDFPQQMAIAADGNLLMAEFSGGMILDFAPDGTLVGQYTPAGLSLFRGVAQLDNGNLLVTSGTGVHEITRAGQFVATRASGSEFRYITRFTPPAEALAGMGPIDPPAIRPVPADPRGMDEILADERGEALKAAEVQR
ncbi:MAG: hypothetical protein LAT64_05385 [Phycisphaerales bacterium]|nr:hypothetical protein [Planctomycetota bacterium]MCH8508188.1 hypothetical protein [Phycisphaerales bacterium]